MAWLILFSLNVRQSIAWRFSFSRSSLCHLRRFSSFSMTDQVPVVPRMGLLQRPLTVQPSLPLRTTHRTLTATWFLRPNLQLRSPRLVFLLSLYSFSLVLASALFVLVFRVCANNLVFASVYRFTILASVLLLSRLCYHFSWRLCINSVFTSVYNFSFPSV